MEVYVDDRRIEVPLEPDESLQDNLRRIRQAGCPPDHVIVGVKCDGVHLLDQQLGDALPKPLSRFDCIEVTTATPAKLVHGALTQAGTVLAEVDQKRAHIAELLAEGKTTEGIAGLTDTLAVWQAVHEAVIKSLHMLSVDVSTLEFDGRSLAQTLSIPRDQLVQIRDAIQTQDYVLVADILQYEFADVIAEWQRLITAISDIAATKQATSSAPS